MKTTIAKLHANIHANCEPFDREAYAASSLDEAYSFSKAGGPFSDMLPSEVLKEIDPIAWRTHVNDCTDRECFEITHEGETENYSCSDCEEQKEELLDELDSQQDEEEDEAKKSEILAQHQDLIDHSF